MNFEMNLLVSGEAWKSDAVILTKIVLIVVALLSLSCGENEERINKETLNRPSYMWAEELRQTDRKRDTVYTEYVRLGKDVPVFRFEFVYRRYDGWGSLKRVLISDSASGTFVQQISGKDIRTSRFYENGEYEIVSHCFDHYNLDDYLDLFLCGAAAHPPEYGFYFIFDWKISRFVYNGQYDKMSSVIVNKKKGVIYSYSHSPSGYWQIDTYVPKGKLFYLIESESQEALEEEIYRIERKVRNARGKMVTIMRRDTTGFTGPGDKYFEEKR